jgi:hypothetical protein
LIKKSGFFLLTLFMLGAAGAWADLEWITGAVPRNTPTQNGSGAVVKDAPVSESGPAPSGNQEIILCHLTTCTRIVNNYPMDPVNYFYLNRNNQICYFAYFLIKPSSRIHTAVAEVFSPAKIHIARYEQEYRVGFTDDLLTINDQTYQYFLFEMTLGMDHMHSEFNQTGLPRDPGLYTIHLTVDGQLVGITFFTVMPEPIKGPSPIPQVPNTAPVTGLPMAPSTNHKMPIQPIPENIQ